jgi:amino acid transporter
MGDRIPQWTFALAALTVVLGTNPIKGQPTGFSVIAAVFSYAAIELVGTAAGEVAHSEKVMPRAINSVIARIALLYVGSLLLLGVLLPSGAYKASESPFVTFFTRIGVTGAAGTIMNVAGRGCSRANSVVTRRESIVWRGASEPLTAEHRSSYFTGQLPDADETRCISRAAERIRLEVNCFAFAVRW